MADTVNSTASVGEIEKRSDLSDGDAGLFEYWMGQEAIVERAELRWLQRARKIVQRYRDERPDSGADNHRFNILWSNTETLKPTLYARDPKPDVQRRFQDQDDVGRLAATLLERSISYQMDNFEFGDEMLSVVEDYLLPGRGTARVLYIPHYGDPIKEPEADGDDENFENADAEQDAVAGEGDEGSEERKQADLQNPPQQLREVVWEECKLDYVFWEDYREGLARKHDQVPWKRYRAYLTRDELVARFGKEKGGNVALDYAPKSLDYDAKRGTDGISDIFKKAEIREVWDKVKKKVCWYAPGTPDLILDYIDDPLGLPGFFPSPDPLFSCKTNDKRIPVPLYIQYQDQARELDTLTLRIDRLTRALKVAGVYPGESKQELQTLFDEGMENRLIAVKDWIAFSDKGGMQNMIQYVPIKEIAEVLIQLYNSRDKVKATLYEITGLSDILRGETEPLETAAAQTLKSNFATRRIYPQQKAVAKFARNAIRLMAAVIANQFSAKTISMITGYPQLLPVPQVPAQPPEFVPAPAAAPAPMPVAAAPGQPPMAPQPPQQQPNPAFAQWQQAAQAAQQVQQQNEQKKQQFEAAVALLKQDGVHGFRLDIEADSTIAPDEQAEKEARTEFLGEFLPMMQQLVPVVQGNPPLAEMAKELVLFGVRGFKVARPLEETIEKAFDALAKMPPAPPKEGKGAGQGSNIDSPADLALRAKESSERTQIAQEKNAIDAAADQAKAKEAQDRLALDTAESRAKIALAERSQEDQRNFRTIRGGALEAREAQGLT